MASKSCLRVASSAGKSAFPLSHRAHGAPLTTSKPAVLLPRAQHVQLSDFTGKGNFTKSGPMKAVEDTQRFNSETSTTGPMENVGEKRFADFELAGRVFCVTGGASGIGLAIAEGLVEAGGNGEQTSCTFQWLSAG